MDQGNYEYHGWQFERTKDGTLRIQPKVVESQADKMDFSTTSTQGIDIPQNELPRLISFALVGRVDEDVVSQIQNLGRVKSTV